MSQPEPALSDPGDSRRTLPPEPPQVDWEAVRRGCPCATCEAARRGEGAAERADGSEHAAADPSEEAPPDPAAEPAAPGNDHGSAAALEARIAALERRLDARLARLESRVDALLRHATREETARASGPLDAAADAIARFVRDVEDVLDDLGGPGRCPRG